ncbi:hypothetical protein CERZMDRAFT_112393 [Cercospora zeae-maydis SCOH1-5]|uniref:D-isomer specific 2-hydroxyacid dehydrogenase NAD-binding domain-containing protein n=1 Tax=Cercospora zeae-maydis SCOH1-5 TaxID=717836 RepID=A0A6A6FDV1_9PEZI|nr:hypothetical protein CERZMDRAFT_112393 [Cercospora zeae-maydis SCOH1-5]
MPEEQEQGRQEKNITALKKVAVLDDYAGIARKHFDDISGVEVSYFDHTLDAAKEEGLRGLIGRLGPYEIISSMRERTAFPPELLSSLPNLKLLLTTGMRNNAISLPAATENGVVVTGTKGERLPDSHYHENETGTRSYEPPPPASGPSSVIQHSWALLLGICSRIAEHHNLLQQDSEEPSWQSGTIISLAGKTLGLLGLGKLGAQFGRIAAQSFGMKIVAWSENLSQEKADEQAAKFGLEKGTFEVVKNKKELCQRADVVSLQLVLSARTEKIVGKEELGWMKGSAILLNTSRGGLVDEEALVECLKRKEIAGFASDVFWEEPLSKDSLWRRVGEWSKSQVLLSPHVAYVNEGTMNRWYEEQRENLERWVRGEEVRDRLN